MATQFLVLQHLRNVANCVLCTYLILLVVHALVIACNISFLSFEALSQQRAPKMSESLKLGMILQNILSTSHQDCAYFWRTAQ